jgi:hypothetical protein
MDEVSAQAVIERMEAMLGARAADTRVIEAAAPAG